MTDPLTRALPPVRKDDLPRDFYRPEPGPARAAIQIYAHLPTQDGPKIFHFNPTFGFQGKQRAARILALGIGQVRSES